MRVIISHAGISVGVAGGRIICGRSNWMDHGSLHKTREVSDYRPVVRFQPLSFEGSSRSCCTAFENNKNRRVWPM
jgi:hypothetical protein